MASISLLSKNEKLVGASNYVSWKWRIQAVLESEDLWDINVQVTAFTTSSGTSSSAVTEGVTLGTDEFTSAGWTVATGGTFDADRRRQLRAFAILKRSVANDVLLYFISATNAREFWAMLRRQFDVRSSARLLMVSQRFLGATHARRTVHERVQRSQEQVLRVPKPFWLDMNDLEEKTDGNSLKQQDEVGDHHGEVVGAVAELELVLVTHVDSLDISC
ncbi:hypothetical protein R1flu_002583 [Riccia fluitans]|uniref:DUF4219 domain-containing protein n=1 Tax=Riccia fluitans TaxID=41844 RepID=A0ABD1Y6I9_9MARC